MAKRTKDEEKPHTVERAEGVVGRYFCGETLLAEDVSFLVEDTKGGTFTRTEFQVRVSGAQLVDLIEEMPVGTKLHLEANLPGVLKTVDFLGLNERNYIGEGELMNYVLNELGCGSMDELLTKDRRAYELAKNIPDVQEAFDGVLKESRKRK